MKIHVDVDDDLKYENNEYVLLCKSQNSTQKTVAESI